MLRAAARPSWRGWRTPKKVLVSFQGSETQIRWHRLGLHYYFAFPGKQTACLQITFTGMKHLLTIFVVVTVARCPSAAFTDDAIPPLKVVEGFLKEDEIDYFLNFEINTNIGESSFYGTATMPSNILNRLPRNQDDLEDHCSSADEMSAVIMTKMMTNTSHFHKDMI